MSSRGKPLRWRQFPIDAALFRLVSSFCQEYLRRGEWKMNGRKRLLLFSRLGYFSAAVWRDTQITVSPTSLNIDAVLREKIEPFWTREADVNMVRAFLEVRRVKLLTKYNGGLLYIIVKIRLPLRTTHGCAGSVTDIGAENKIGLPGSLSGLVSCVNHRTNIFFNRGNHEYSS